MEFELICRLLNYVSLSPPPPPPPPQIRNPVDETQCQMCPKGTAPDLHKQFCQDIPEVFLRPESGWAIGAMAFSSTGMLVTLFVVGVFLR